MLSPSLSPSSPCMLVSCSLSPHGSHMAGCLHMAGSMATSSSFLKLQDPRWKRHFSFLKIFIYLFWLCWVRVAARGLLVVACLLDLVPWPGIVPEPPALGAWSLIHFHFHQGSPETFLFLTPVGKTPGKDSDWLDLDQSLQSGKRGPIIGPLGSHVPPTPGRQGPLL